MWQLTHRRHSLRTRTGRSRQLTIVLAGVSLAVGLTASLIPVGPAVAITRYQPDRASSHTQPRSQLSGARLADGSAAVLARLRSELAGLPAGARLAGPPAAKAGPGAASP